MHKTKKFVSEEILNLLIQLKSYDGVLGFWGFGVLGLAVHPEKERRN